MEQDQYCESEKRMTESHEARQQVVNCDFGEYPRADLASESPVYPSGLKLVFIFVALCLTVFLVALVSI